MSDHFSYTENHICEECGEEFQSHSLKANHIRWKHRDQDGFDQKMSDIKKRFYKNKLGEIKDFRVVCKSCNEEFIVKEREFKFPMKDKYFCCVSCANKYSSSFKNPLSEDKRKIISDKIKEFWKDPEYAKKRMNNKFSSKGEREIRKILKERYGSKSVSSHRKIEMNNIKKAVDLTIKEKNIIIEYDGIWHFDRTIHERFGNPKKYFEVIEKDKMVKEYCKLNSIRLLRIGDKYYQNNKRKALTEIICFIEDLDLLFQELY